MTTGGRGFPTCETIVMHGTKDKFLANNLVVVSSTIANEKQCWKVFTFFNNKIYSDNPMLDISCVTVLRINIWSQRLARPLCPLHTV